MRLDYGEVWSRYPALSRLLKTIVRALNHSGRGVHPLGFSRDREAPYSLPETPALRCPAGMRRPIPGTPGSALALELPVRRGRRGARLSCARTEPGEPGGLCDWIGDGGGGGFLRQDGASRSRGVLAT